MLFFPALYHGVGYDMHSYCKNNVYECCNDGYTTTQYKKQNCDQRDAHLNKAFVHGNEIHRLKFSFLIKPMVELDL